MQDLEPRQKDYAIYLPAISGAYIGAVSKTYHDPNYVDPKRVPPGLINGPSSLDFFRTKDAVFRYPWGLYSAGHATLDINKASEREHMVYERDRSSTFLLGDSGGFQIAKGRWPGNWADSKDEKAQTTRHKVLQWLEKHMDYSMILDIPTWTYRDKKAAQACGIHSYQDAIDATEINNEYFIRNRRGHTKFLNVLQGGNHTEAENWYQLMKKYADPKIYPGAHFEGWSMGGQNMCDIHLILQRLIALRFDGLLEKGVHDWMHFLGTSKLEWAVMFTDIQRAIRKYHNENFTISFDCASPFLASANGLIYSYNRIEDRSKWTYHMESSVDDKKYSLDTRQFADVLRDDIGLTFIDSPVTDAMRVCDICCYKPGDLNKLGKEGKTSWDSFSYCIQMGHNTWAHINAVLTANEKYDQNIVPAMLVKTHFDELFFRDIINEIFATSDRQRAESLVEEHSRFWTSIIGTRGYTGKRVYNGHAAFNSLFSTDAAETEINPDNLDIDVLEQMETAAEND